MTHGFFLQMGGFVLYENEYPKKVLVFSSFISALHGKKIDAPTVTEQELQDRSKGNAISKAIVVLQTSWFAFQCIGRLAQRLPLSELEVITLAFAFMNAAIYAAWWNKPQGADTAICIPLKLAKGVIHPHPRPAGPPQANCQHSNDKVPSIPPHEYQQDQSTGETEIWLRSQLRKDRSETTSPVFFFFHLPLRIVSYMFHPFEKISMGNLPKPEALRVPMFYAEDFIGYRSQVLASCIFGTIFGAIHLIAWVSEFPSHPDHVLWRVSAIIMIVEPLLIGPAATSRGEGEGFVLLIINSMRDLSYWLATYLIPLYVAARFVVIIIALLAIRHPPHNVLVDLSWTSLLPHF